MTTTDNGTILTQRSGGIQFIELNRPEKLNAVTFDMYDAMTASIVQAEQDQEVRVMLFHGRGDSFTAGNDLGDFLNNPPTSTDTPAVRFFRALSQATKPVVAAVQGHAVGVGTTMLFHCDLVYASEDAQFLMPFVNLGLVPEAGSSYLLPRLAGHQRVANVLLLANPLDSLTMHQLGLVTAVVPKDQLLPTATASAQALCAKPPAALVATKRLMKEATASTVAAAIESELRSFSIGFRHQRPGRCLPPSCKGTTVGDERRWSAWHQSRSPRAQPPAWVPGQWSCGSVSRVRTRS